MATADTSTATNKEFEDLKVEVARWIDKCENKVKILRCDNSEKRIDFHVADNSQISFYLTVQNKESSENALEPIFHLWSEEEKALEILSSAIEYSTSRTLVSLPSLLDKTFHCLQKFLNSNDKERKLSDDEEDQEEDDEDDDGAADDYYNVDEEEEAVETKEKESEPEDSDDDSDELQLFGESSNPAAIDRLTKDMKIMKRISGKYGFKGSPRENNLFIWDVFLTDIPATTLLGKDMKKYSEKCNVEPVVAIEIHFPGSYPFDPPFIRIVKPRFKFLTGHVTVGGSICMQLLTKSGWLPIYDIEQILVQVRSAILSDDRAQLDHHYLDNPYTMQEAKVAFNRMVLKYGWNK